MDGTGEDIEILPLAVPPSESNAGSLFWGHVKNRWPVYLAGMGAVVVTNMTEVMMPKCVQWTVDLLNSNALPLFLKEQSKEHAFFTVVFILVVAWIVQGLSRRYWRMSLGRETHLVEATLRSSVWERARLFPSERLQRDLSVGVLMNVGTGDARIARAVFGWLIVGVTDVIFLGSFTLLAMALISPSLTLAAIAIAPLIAFLLRRLQTREFQLHAIAQERLSTFNDLASQSVATVKLQRITQTAELWRHRLLTAAQIYRDARYRVVQTTLSFFAVMGSAPLFSYTVIFFLGIDRVLAGSLTLGEFVAFQSYVLVLQGPLSELGSVLGELQRGVSSLERIAEVYRVSPASGLTTTGLTSVPATEPLLEVRSLTFRYGSRVILKDLSFSVPKGGRIGLTGPIGVGKSTLLNVISGLERDYEGEVLLGGSDIRGYTHETLRHFIAIVPQRPFLFATTVRENLRLDGNCADDELWRVLEICGIADEIRALPSGLDTMLGEWGINLSGGQKQRLTLARALLKRPGILLLDDCLSAVDTITEERILERLNRELGGTTILWTAHRSSTLRYCDRIVALEGL